MPVASTRSSTVSRRIVPSSIPPIIRRSMNPRDPPQGVAGAKQGDRAHRHRVLQRAGLRPVKSPRPRKRRACCASRRRGFGIGDWGSARRRNVCGRGRRVSTGTRTPTRRRGSLGAGASHRSAVPPWSGCTPRRRALAVGFGVDVVLVAEAGVHPRPVVVGIIRQPVEFVRWWEGREVCHVGGSPCVGDAGNSGSFQMNSR